MTKKLFGVLGIGAGILGVTACVIGTQRGQAFQNRVRQTWSRIRSRMTDTGTKVGFTEDIESEIRPDRIRRVI